MSTIRLGLLAIMLTAVHMSVCFRDLDTKIYSLAAWSAVCQCLWVGDRTSVPLLTGLLCRNVD